MMNNAEKIKSFRSLKEGWNAGSGSSISDKVIDKALKALKEIENNELEIFPTGMNTVQFEWGDFEIEIGEEAIDCCEEEECMDI
jgi:hypothetical protein